MTRAEALSKARDARWRAQAELVASLGDGGLWSWRSSPHVLWLASVLEGYLD
jgi:hypothetical protein